MFKPNLGDEVFVDFKGEVTEMRKVGDKIRYTITDQDTFEQAFVYDTALYGSYKNLKMERNDDATTKTSITKGK